MAVLKGGSYVGGDLSVASNLYVGGVVSAATFCGAGTGLTGTASNLSVQNATCLGGTAAASYVLTSALATSSVQNATCLGGIPGGRGGTGCSCYSVAFGMGALNSITTGQCNTAMGTSSLYCISVGHCNTAIGANTLFLNCNGCYNTAVGTLALNAVINNCNTALGTLAGLTLTTGSNNIIIGYNVQTATIDTNNVITIGNSTNDTLILSGCTVWTRSGGVIARCLTYEEATAGTYYPLMVCGNAAGTCPTYICSALYWVQSTGTLNSTYFNATSLREKKKDIEEYTGCALCVVGNTKIVCYVFKEDKTNSKHIGFIADDTPEELSTKEHNTMSITDSIGILLKAVQELQQEIGRLSMDSL